MSAAAGFERLLPSRAVQAQLRQRNIPVVEGYTSEVTELLPLIAKLNPVGLHALKRILANPSKPTRCCTPYRTSTPNW